MDSVLRSEFYSSQPKQDERLQDSLSLLLQQGEGVGMFSQRLLEQDGGAESRNPLIDLCSLVSSLPRSPP